jgi:hypothetical protein
MRHLPYGLRYWLYIVLISPSMLVGHFQFLTGCSPTQNTSVQAADRALLVDTLPTAQQERGNAWAGRMLSIGSVVGFFVSVLSLKYIYHSP